MTAADIAAYIGAAAWVPQIISWVHAYWVRPDIRIVQSRTSEIGFTSFGPIINFSCALLANRKDALINSMRLTAKHEKGREYRFDWSGLHEFASLQAAPGAGSGKAAIALNLVTGSMVEKTVGFQDLEFQRKASNLAAAAKTQLTYLQNANQPSEVQIQSKEYNEIVNHFKYATAWEEGAYSLTLELQVMGEDVPRTFLYKLHLSNSEMQRLRANTIEIENFLKDTFITQVTDKTYLWYWAYPNLDLPTPSTNEIPHY